MILTVDLASKFSAAMVRDADGRVHREFDSNGKSSFQFARELRQAADDFHVELVVIEDVPYGISSQAMTKPVLRLQGIVIALLAPYLDRMYFLNPATWQRHFPGVGTALVPKGSTKKVKDEARIEAARSHAELLGYSAPDLIGAYVSSLPEGAKVLKKHTDPLAKTMTDYCDAFLMSVWCYAHLKALPTLSGVQRPSI